MFHADPDRLLDALLDVMLCAAGVVADKGTEETTSGTNAVVGKAVVDVVHGLAMQSRCSWGCPLHGAPPSPGVCSMSRVLI